MSPPRDQPDSRMPRLRSLTACPSSSAAEPGLRVIDETARPAAPVRRTAPSWDALSPMPLAGARQEKEKEVVPPSGDGFDDNVFAQDFLPSRQAGENGKLKELPRFVPLQCEVFSAGGDPWTVRSVGDLLKLYLPEISISTGVVAASAALGGRMISRLAGGSLGPEVLVIYLALHSVFLALAYISAVGNPSARAKGRMRMHLLGAFLVLALHVLAYGLLVAGR